MGNYFGFPTPEPLIYTVEDAENETNSNNKNMYYWLGLTSDDVEVYQLMENDAND